MSEITISIPTEISSLWILVAVFAILALFFSFQEGLEPLIPCAVFLILAVVTACIIIF